MTTPKKKPATPPPKKREPPPTKCRRCGQTICAWCPTYWDVHYGNEVFRQAGIDAAHAASQWGDAHGYNLPDVAKVRVEPVHELEAGEGGFFQITIKNVRRVASIKPSDETTSAEEIAALCRAYDPRCDP